MTPEEHRDEALRRIAALTVRARASTDGMGQLTGTAATDYLCDVEHVLASLIVLGAVPGAAVVRGEVIEVRRALE